MPSGLQTDYCTCQWVEQDIADSLIHAINHHFELLLEYLYNTAVVDAVAAFERKTHQLPQFIARTLQRSRPDLLIDSEAMVGQP